MVFPLEGVDVEQIAKEIEQVKGPQGKVVGMKTTNSLLVTDIGANLRRIQSLLSGATRGGPNDLVFKPYSMRHLPRDRGGAGVARFAGSADRGHQREW